MKKYKDYSAEEAGRQSVAIAHDIIDLCEKNDCHPAHAISGCCAVISILVNQLPPDETRKLGTKMVYDILERMLTDPDLAP